MPVTAMEMALSASVELAGDTSRPEPRKGRDAARQGEKIPHPLWSMEFVATYCYESTTGFHYSRLAPGDGDGPQWRTIQDIWFVTIGQSYNRRVTRPAENEHSLFPFAETLTLGGNP